jgi:AcrR family transcriptional regulator
MGPVVKRSYRSPTRRRQRSATRAAVVAAAEQCFVEHGYAATTIASIAEVADVSPETVYAIFGTKRALLQSVVETAVTGDSTGAGLLRDELLDRIRAEPDQRRRFDLMTEGTRDLLRRSAPIEAVVRAAASTDPEIAAMVRERDQQTLKDVRMLVRLLAEAGPLRMPEADAADMMWAFAAHSDFYRTLTTDRRWSHRRASDALSDVLTRMLFDD